MEICTDNRCGQIIATYEDMIRHRGYHCNQEVRAYQNKSGNGIVDRRAPYGFGVPNMENVSSGKKPYFAKSHKRGNCVICNYSMGKYQWCQVFGHVEATHGYKSRIPNERWGVAIMGKFQDQNNDNKSKNPKIKERGPKGK